MPQNNNPFFQNLDKSYYKSKFNLILLIFSSVTTISIGLYLGSNFTNTLTYFQNSFASNLRYQVTGTVVISDGNQEIPAANVGVWDEMSSKVNTYTNAEGKFTLSLNPKGGLKNANKNPIGLYYLAAMKEGYKLKDEIPVQLQGKNVDNLKLVLQKYSDSRNIISVKGAQFMDGNIPFYFIGAQSLTSTDEWIRRHRAGWVENGVNKTYYSQFDPEFDKNLSPAEVRDFESEVLPIAKADGSDITPASASNSEDSISSFSQLKATTNTLGKLTVDRIGINFYRSEDDYKNTEQANGNIEAPIMIGKNIDEKGLLGLDREIQVARNHGRRLILTFMNGGEDGSGDSASIETLLGKKTGTFATDRDTIKFFQNYMSTVLNHVSILSGVKIKDDPTILAFDLCNEAYFSNSDDWYVAMAKYFKTLDNKHLITTGKDGNYESYLHEKSIDFATMHVYPTVTDYKDGKPVIPDGGFLPGSRYPNGHISSEYPFNSLPHGGLYLPETMDQYKQYIRNAIDDAYVANKPLVIEEVGTENYIENNPSLLVGTDSSGKNIYGSNSFRANWTKTIVDAIFQKPTTSVVGTQLDDSGFENGPNNFGGWRRADTRGMWVGTAPTKIPSSFTSNLFSIDSTNVYDGKYSLKISPSSKTGITVYQDFKVTSNTRFYLGASAMNNDPSKTAKISVEGWDGTNWNEYTEGTVFTVVNDGKWHRYGGISNTKNYQYLRVELTTDQVGTGTVWFDDADFSVYTPTKDTTSLIDPIPGLSYWSFYPYEKDIQPNMGCGKTNSCPQGTKGWYMSDSYAIDYKRTLLTAELGYGATLASNKIESQGK